MWTRLRSRWKRFHGLASVLGWRGAGQYLVQLGRPDHGPIFRIRTRSALHPLFVRPNSSDLDVFAQVFISREYECLDDLRGVRLIVDAGANVGYSSAYFLSAHPDSEIVAVEPDPENFAMLKRNLAPYGCRVKAVHAAVWSHPTRLALSCGHYRDGREWTRQVRPSDLEDASAIEAVTIDALLSASARDRISILKMDVEGAEAVIFSNNHQPWLDRVDAIAIELHDNSIFGKATEVFFTAIEGRGFRVSTKGELTICRKGSS